MQPNKTLSVNGEPFEVLRLLGKGKGGYSFLVRSQSHSKTEYVLKQMHHEPMPFLQPNDKVQAEIRDYRRLCELGIRLPAMLDIDIAKERILKEYIDGPTVYNLVLTDQMDDSYAPGARDGQAPAIPPSEHRLLPDEFRGGKRAGVLYRLRMHRLHTRTQLRRLGRHLLVEDP